MPASLTDAQLLREFAASRDQRAFAELVARHKDMVFSTALRRAGRPDLAADVAQQVFLALATKAAWLSTRVTVGGWLYKSTLLETVRRQRDEARRHARERRYAEEEMKLHPPDETPAQDDEAHRAKALLPHLDDALSALPDPDREAIVLRFLRGLSLRDTGAALGTSEEAARKRVSRALEKLSASFHRRGVTASAAMLAATVLPRAVDAAAPAGLGATLAGVGAAAPATGPAGALFLKAAALNKAQIVAACALTAAVPVTWQAVQIRDLTQQNQALLATRAAGAHPFSAARAPAPVAVAATPSSESPPSAAADTPPSPPKHDRRGKWEEWRDLQRQQQRESRLAALHDRLGLDDIQLSVIAEASAQAETDGQALHDAVRDTGRPPDPADIAALDARRDQAIAEALGPDQWTDYQAFVLEEEAGRREIFANRLLADLQTTLHLSDSQKDQLFAHFASEAALASPEAWRAPIESMDNAQTEKLAELLTDDQFKLWRQRAELWSQLFRRSPDPR